MVKSLFFPTCYNLSTPGYHKAAEIYLRERSPTKKKKENKADWMFSLFVHARRALFSMLGPLNSDGFRLPAMQTFSQHTTGRDRRAAGVNRG